MPPTSKDIVRRSTRSASRNRTQDAELPDPAPEVRDKRRKYDWDRAELMFIEGVQRGDEIFYPNLPELANILGYPLQRLRQRSADRRWHDRRQTHQLEIVRQKAKERAVRLAKDAVQFDESALSAAKLGVAMVTTRLGEIAQESSGWQARRDEAKQRIAEGLPVDKGDLYSPIRHAELLNLASALTSFQSVGMRALGTDVQKHEISGPDGGPIETAISVTKELIRDDPDRLAQQLKAMADAGLIQLNVLEEAEDEDVQDAEVVEVGDDERS